MNTASAPYPRAGPGRWNVPRVTATWQDRTSTRGKGHTPADPSRGTQRGGPAGHDLAECLNGCIFQRFRALLQLPLSNPITRVGGFRRLMCLLWSLALTG